MYALTMLKKEQLEFVLQCNNTGCGRSMDFSIALGKVIADNISLPSSKVLDPKSEYMHNFKMGVYSTISPINELIIVDIDRVVSYVDAFYLARYNLVYGNKSIIISDEDQLTDFFGLNKYIDKVTLEEIKASGKKIMYYYNELSKLVEFLSRGE